MRVPCCFRSIVRTPINGPAFNSPRHVQMSFIIQPLLRPVPLLSISTAGLIIAVTSSPARRPLHASMASTQAAWPSKAYQPRHTAWPYQPADFQRADPSSDDGFYSAPRFVTHIDDAAIASLRAYYDTVLPRSGKILDFCSSWISHYPQAIEDAASKGSLKVVGMGMNAAELENNPVLNAGRVLSDLNDDPSIEKALSKAGGDDRGFDAATCVVSIDYLIKPVEVLSSLRDVIKTGGTVHLTISNRCFPTKAIHRWLRISEDERLLMVADYLHYAGWSNIEIVELSNGKVGDRNQPQSSQPSLQNLMSFIGMGSRDPLWVVRGTT